MPPEPWPAVPVGGFPHHLYGPPGTEWLISESDWTSRTSEASESALKWFLKKVRPWSSPQGAAYRIWTVPDPIADPAEPVEEPPMPMTWARTAIQGVIGTDESVVHTLNWRHSTTENAPLDAAGLKLLGDAVRDKWLAFLNGAMPSGAVVKSQLPTQLRYTEVRTSVLTQAGPAEDPVWGPQTVVSPFAAGVVGTAVGQPLPYEVAMGISLNTNWRGTSRFRGRLYLGPISQDAMTQNGQFLATVVDGIGSVFGTQVIAGVKAATDYECHIVSQKFNTSAEVIGVRMGEVPDSQRRRRRNRPESYAQVWGLPVGSL